MHQQVNDTIGVVPLVVIPKHDLEETLLTWRVILQSGLRIVDGSQMLPAGLSRVIIRFTYLFSLFEDGR